MIDTDNAEFLKIMNSCGTVYNRKVTNELLEIYWNQLMDYSIQDVSLATKKYLKTGKFFPTIADLIELLPNNNNHIGADEAWTIVIESMDEYKTVIATEEIMQAREIAMDIYNDGDKTGARMAFRDAYNRIISNTTTKPKWFISAGFDAATRAQAIEKAVSLGRLPAGSGEQHTIGHDKPTMTFNGLVKESTKRISHDNFESRKQKALAWIDQNLNKYDKA